MYEQFVVPLALILVLLSGIGPVIAWRRANGASLRRNLLRPALAGVVVVGVLIAFGVTSSVTALMMFGFGGFVLAGIGQEFWRGVRARRAVARESVPVALVSLVRRNRRRYGGYLVHVGIVVLFVGVAASSSFKDVRDVALNPGQSARGGRQGVHVRQADRRAARGAERPPRADLARRRPARGRQAPCTPRRTTSRRRTRSWGRSRASSTARRRPRSRSTRACGKDTWAAVGPDIAKLRPRLEEGDRLFANAADDLSAEDSNQFLALALRGLTDGYANNPPPARFRFEVNPMVTWIWLGTLIVMFGAFIAGLAHAARADAGGERPLRGPRRPRRARACSCLRPA